MVAAVIGLLVVGGFVSALALTVFFIFRRQRMGYRHGKAKIGPAGPSSLNTFDNPAFQIEDDEDEVIV